MSKITPKRSWAPRCHHHHWSISPDKVQLWTSVDTESIGHHPSVTMEIFQHSRPAYDSASFEKMRAFWMARSEAVADALNSWEQSRIAFLDVLRIHHRCLTEVVKHGYMLGDLYFWFDTAQFKADSPVVSDIQDFLQSVDEPHYDGEDTFWEGTDEETRMMAQLLICVLDDILELWE